MNRRTFLQVAAASPMVAGSGTLPAYHIVSRFNTLPQHGMPGQYPGKAVRAQAERAVDIASNRIDPVVVDRMLAAAVCELTGCPDNRDAWSRFVSPHDIVGIKVNCSGAPEINTNPELVGAIARALIKLGVPSRNIYVYDRFSNQTKMVNFAGFLPEGVTVEAAEDFRGSILRYDPFTYVEVDFFGEDDTRSNLFRPVSEKYTKVINVPTMKEHRAAGVTGCLKNIAYGSFSNVARSHEREKSNTYSFIGTLASVEPLRSRTVLNVMDGLRSLWHGGPFLQSPKFLFFPKRIVVGTDPVALDHLLIDMLEKKRQDEGAPSLFDRSLSRIKPGPELDPNFNSFVREPGHVEYASRLGLGVYNNVAERVISL